MLLVCSPLSSVVGALLEESSGVQENPGQSQGPRSGHPPATLGRASTDREGLILKVLLLSPSASVSLDSRFPPPSLALVSLNDSLTGSCPTIKPASRVDSGSSPSRFAAVTWSRCSRVFSALLMSLGCR